MIIPEDLLEENLDLNKNINFKEKFEKYNYTLNVNNIFPNSNKKFKKPLILLDGWYNNKVAKKDFKYAYIKEDSFLYVLKFNIIKKFIENNLINLNDLTEDNLTPHLIVVILYYTYPKLVYYKNQGTIINDYKIEISPGYISLLLNNSSSIFNIFTKFNSNKMYEMYNICNEEIKLLMKNLEILDIKEKDGNLKIESRLENRNIQSGLENRNIQSGLDNDIIEKVEILEVKEKDGNLKIESRLESGNIQSRLGNRRKSRR